MGNGKRQSARLAARQAARQASKQSTQHPPSQQHLSTPSPPLATIHDLPLEIIGRIITIAYPAPSSKASERRERYGFLKATSLVCREWTPFAQEELWIDVYLYEEQIQSFFEAGAGRHATHKLSVTYGSRKDDSVEAVLRNVRGVRELGLTCCTASMDWLCGDNFKGLKTLDLSYAVESAASTSTLLPFALTTLKLNYREDPLSISRINALSRQSSITSLVIKTDDFDPTALLTRLAPLAPGLDTLDISLRDVPGAAGDFLKGCTHLKHLKTGNLPLNSVNHVAASLASWTVNYIDYNQVSTLVGVLETGSIATAKLEKLVFESSSVRASPGWLELVKMCKEKKIKLINVDREGRSEIIV